ncbi:MAG TPA: hypothetical protein VH000_11120 [Rhizomicrobium sp.]|nr:hypothetical protein [Rhizomicrobium sp.]
MPGTNTQQGERTTEDNSPTLGQEEPKDARETGRDPNLTPSKTRDNLGTPGQSGDDQKP